MINQQLPLVGPARPPVGTLLAGVRVDGQPVRAKHACVCHPLGARRKMSGAVWVRIDAIVPGTRPMDTWRDWRDDAVEDLKLVAQEQGWRTYNEPVIAGVVAVFRRPRTPRKNYQLKKVVRPYPFEWTEGRVGFVGRPDHDQVVKAGVDVMVQAGILCDDPLVVGYAPGISRWYAAIGEEPHLEVRLWSAT